jgi:hypothetical protein
MSERDWLAGASLGQQEGHLVQGKTRTGGAGFCIGMSAGAVMEQKRTYLRVLYSLSISSSDTIPGIRHLGRESSSSSL